MRAGVERNEHCGHSGAMALAIVGVLAGSMAGYAHGAEVVVSLAPETLDAGVGVRTVGANEGSAERFGVALRSTAWRTPSSCVSRDDVSADSAIPRSRLLSRAAEPGSDRDSQTGLLEDP